MRSVSVGVMALLLVVPPAAAQVSKPAPAPPTASSIAKKAHRLVLQVNTNDPATMNLALNNATNVEQYVRVR
jgi:hypothetical protein